VQFPEVCRTANIETGNISFIRYIPETKERPMNLNKLMKQAQKMQEQMAKTQAELEEKTVEVQAGGGKVTVVANGAGDVVSIKIAKEIVDPEDVEFLEEALLSGVKQAIEQGKALAQSEMTKITGGMGLGGLGL
jgi:DNA-binding YbaB/EbfC family protein